VAFSLAFYRQSATIGVFLTTSPPKESAAMQIKMPVCPKCGSAKVKVIGKHPHYAELRQRPKTEDEEPISWTIGFKCECGLGFTEHVKNVPPPKT
jgi:hypothetical protein